MATAPEREERIPLTKLYEVILPHDTGVRVTVLNIIQCIAVALLVSELRDAYNKNQLSIYCAVRATTTSAVILVVWHRYISESRYLWPIRWEDTLIPFFMGVNEYVMVFTINDTAASLYAFAMSIFIFSVITIASYGNAHWTRRRREVIRLYHDFYPNNPQFVNHLIRFLDKFTEDNMREVSIMMTFSAMLYFLIYHWPIEMWEFIFPGVVTVILIAREMMASFQVALEQDSVLMFYFSEGRNP